MSTAKETVERLMGLSEQLESIVSKENEILETRRPRELEQFRQEKEAVGHVYQSTMQALKDDPSMLAGADANDVAALKSVTLKLHQLLNENFRRVAAAKTVTERLFKTIGDEIADKRQPLKGYTAKATFAVPGAYAGAATIPIAINQVV